MNKYEIHIGKALNANNLNETIPLQKIIITQEQLEVIEMFASKRKDAELNTIYKLNECEFRIFPLAVYVENKTSTNHENGNNANRLLVAAASWWDNLTTFKRELYIGRHYSDDTPTPDKINTLYKMYNDWSSEDLVQKKDEIRWPDADRLRMIDKSEFYSEPRVYQYGYYDGYQIQNEKINRAVKLIQEARQNSDRSDAILQDAIILLLGQACV